MPRPFRAARLALLLALAAAPATADGTGPVAVWFEAPGDVYPHRAPGRIPDYFVLAVRDRTGRVVRADLRSRSGPPAVFEDIVPRLADTDGDGTPDVVVVETDLARGARFTVWSLDRGTLRRVAATPPVGTRFRWLAPAAIADLDGDGVTELAHVETPHVAPRLKVWRRTADGLALKAELPGVTNHRIGDEALSGGLRDCGAGPEIVLADSGWQRLVAVRLDRGRLIARPVPDRAEAAGFAAALACR